METQNGMSWDRIGSERGIDSSVFKGPLTSWILSEFWEDAHHLVDVPALSIYVCCRDHLQPLVVSPLNEENPRKVSFFSIQPKQSKECRSFSTESVSFASPAEGPSTKGLGCCKCLVQKGSAQYSSSQPWCCFRRRPRTLSQGFRGCRAVFRC